MSIGVMSTKLYTKFGAAKPNKDGYYQITSKKEGNCGKYLHRLLFEDFYGCEIPKNYVVHHKNGNHIDNCILNLQLMETKKHLRHHNIGEKNYIYGRFGDKAPFYGRKHTEESKKKIGAASKNRIPSEETRKKMSVAHKGRTNSLESKINMSKNRNTSGYFRVSKIPEKNTSQGFFWKYSYIDENGKHRGISSVDIHKLEIKVTEKGLEWIKYDEGDVNV